MPWIHRDGGVFYEGGRSFVRLAFAYDWLDALPWSGFLAVEKALKRIGASAGELEHRYTEENYGGLVAVFEVVSHVRD